MKSNAASRFSGGFPGNQRAGGQICGQQCLADAPNCPRLEHAPDPFQHGRQWQLSFSGNFGEGSAHKTGNLIFRDREDAGVDRIGMFNRDHQQI